MSTTTSNAPHQSGTRATYMALRERLAEMRLPLPVLIYMITVITPIHFSAGPLAMTLLRFFLLFMIVPLTINLFSGKYGKIIPTDWLYVVHMGWVFVALAVNNPTKVIEFSGSTGLEFIGGYVLARAYIRSREDFIKLTKLLVFTLILMLPFALFEAKTSVPIIPKFLNSLPGIKSVSSVYQDPRMGLDRVQAVFAHPIHYGLYASMVFSSCYIGMQGIYSFVTRYVLSAMICFSVFLSLSSGALMSMVLQLGLITWAWVFQKTDKRWLYLLILFIICYIIIDLLSNRTPVRVFVTYATFSPHTAYWRLLIFEFGMNNVWANPIFGLGLNDWARPAFMVTGSMDNFWLVNAVRYGIPGFLLIAAGFGWVLWKVGFRDFDDDRILWQLRRGWMITFVGLTFTLCTVHVWATIFSFTFFFFGSGVWMITAEPEGKTRPGEPSGNAAPQRGTFTYARGREGAPMTARVHDEMPATQRRSEKLHASRGESALPARSRAPAAPRAAEDRQPRYTRFPAKDAQPDDTRKK